MNNTSEAKVRQAIFKFVQMHMKIHQRAIRQPTSAKTGSPSNRYYTINALSSDKGSGYGNEGKGI